MRGALLVLLVLPCVFVLASCNSAAAPEDPAVARGRQAYMGNCIACHNMNPALTGAVGPEVKGASRALLEARILRAEYPPGYQAKRDTKLMPAQPQLAGSIDDLAAFLK